MSKVLWVVDNELDGAKFEKLCVDLLHRHGFLDIVPVEPQDGGRDAEEFPRRGRGREGHPAFFQFSLEKNWKSKLRRDAKKLVPRKMEFDTFVFVTSRKARGVDIDTLKTEFRTKFGWTLVIYSREWLRLQLEEANPDLATKYLGADFSGMSSSPVAAAPLQEPHDLTLREINRLIESDQCDSAIVQLREILKHSPDGADALQLLAWAYYRIHLYEDALSQINRSIKLDDKAQYRSIRACILAEKGIRDHDRSSLLEARRIFEELLVSQPVQTWHIFYNLANVLGSLGQHEAAIERYCTAIQLDERQPSVWKNLASAYHLVGKHNEEMNCFDKALELDPQQPEALISKANSLMIDFQRPEEAAPLLELALTFHPDMLARWPHICYWLALAHERQGHLEKALDFTEQGLAQHPGDFATKRLKSHLLRNLSRRDPIFRDRARSFWRHELEEEPRNFDARKQLIYAEIAGGNEFAAWQLIDESFEILDIHNAVSLQTSTIPLKVCVHALRYLPEYGHFRSSQPVSEYWDLNDPLFDLPFEPPPEDLVESALRSYFAVPFGNGWCMLKSAKDKNYPGTLVRFFDIVRDGIRTATAQAARALASLVPIKEDGTEAMASKVTELMVFMALLALREFGKQRGYITGYLGVVEEARNLAMDGYDENWLHSEVLTETFRVLNEELQILPG